jgi:hypothetical protein
MAAALIIAMLIGASRTAIADTPPPSPPVSAERNLVGNPSFELTHGSRPDRPALWTTMEGWPNAYAASGGHTGAHYVGSALAGRETQQGCDLPNANWLTEGNIPVDARKTYTLSFWTRSVLLSPTAHDMPVAGFQFFDATGAEIGTAATDRGPLDLSDWTVFSYTVGADGITWPTATASVRINLGGAGWDYGATCVERQVYALQAFDDVAFAERGIDLPPTGHGPDPTEDSLPELAIAPVLLAVAGLWLASIGFSSRATY